MRRAALALILLAAWGPCRGAAAADPLGPQDPPRHEHLPPQTRPAVPQEHEEERPMRRASELLMGLASGTSLDPASAPRHMVHASKGDWTLMYHGSAFVTGVIQSGPRGDDEVVSTNWLMAAATRPLGRGAIMLRGMITQEPLTVGDGFYPELFQTGEVHDGEPIVDGQHPHDFFMELAALYARPFGERSALLVYAAPRGDPALGPSAFPHRSSNAENPVAALGHHLQDSTHITADVVTAGWETGRLRFEASGFHGAEPDGARWNLSQGRIDSVSARITFLPGSDWAAQVSRGRLEDPEEHEPGDLVRTTASVLYNRSLRAGGIAAGLIWGENKLVEEGGLKLGSWLAEAVWRFRSDNFLFGRFERVDRNELFAGDPSTETAFESAGIRFFTVNAFTAGYTRNLGWLRSWETGLGADATVYGRPAELEPFYGSRPRAFHVFLRVRPAARGGDHSSRM